MKTEQNTVFSHACEVLEYARLLELICLYTGSAAGGARVRALRPEAGVKAIQARRAIFTDCQTVLTAGAYLPMLHVPELGDLLLRLAPEGGVLPGEELLPVAKLLEVTRTAADFSRGKAVEHCRYLRDLLGGLDAMRPLAAQFQRTLDENGHLQDNASPLLVELRQRTHQLEATLQRRLEAALRSLSAEPGMLQESFVTQRNGRYVIPIRREAKNRFSGVVHDHSDSGRTLFVEPADTLPLGNELADIRLEERDECRRILAELCAAVRLASDGLRQNLEILAKFDAAGAVARWAAAAGAVMPRFGACVSLRQARHPLLLHQFQRAKREDALVPIDVRLPPDCRVLLISGPNCGGKTAALKTIGLLALAAQTGLPVTADADSEFIFFPQIFADTLYGLKSILLSA